MDRGHLTLTHVYRWRPRRFGPLAGFDRFRQPCRILARGTLNSCLVQFADGFTAVVSRNAIRRAA